MDPKKIHELILAGRDDSGSEMNYNFDVSEVLEEFSAVNKAMKELEIAVREFDSQTGFYDDFAEIDRKLQASKLDLEFEGVDAAYEM